MSSGSSTIGGAGYAAEKARDNGAPEWLVIVIFVLVIGVFCFCEISRHTHTNKSIRAQSALDQEAVSFMTDERE
tara:strand:- start:10820 stop:11041 length:222 start_codon:yes stop_codon:yes gene_type:complete